MSAAIGIIANPLSGRDVRRTAARAGSSGPAEKRNEVARVVIGAVAAGAERVLVAREPFRVSTGAVESLRIDAEIEVLEIEAKLRAEDTVRAAEAMREAGCRAVVVLGGDGTNRAVARTWSDAPLVPLSTGTNNVFPKRVEPTLGGAAAGLVASGQLALEEVSRRAKVVRVEIEGEADDLALVDVALLVNDHVGNLLPFDPSQIRSIVLSRAEPAAVGTSPIGGLLEPSGPCDDWGVAVDLAREGEKARSLLAPIAPGLYRSFPIAAWRRLQLGERVRLEGRGVLAFDGDRERRLAPGQAAHLCVLRDGPHVVDVDRTLALAARSGLLLDRTDWNDPYDRFLRHGT
jgi:hypothetical protein